ncbi:MAG: hypothetical protein KBF17_12975 [Candidatus Promineofilum sp.]|nr:hypothetical protein [Promineifilum sp.]MBP9657350.1 hypothetical protein [Promineifilum sp.]
MAANNLPQRWTFPTYFLFLLYPGDEPHGNGFRMRAGVRLTMRSLSLAGPLEVFQARCRELAEELTEGSLSV